ncbi:ferredoxin-NADP reductase [Pseudomonas sp. 2725]|jgi:ferredoxin-NADP reductase|uniref:2Fe-2S iron-sulfur cluster-binding protein n=1 Tax=Pseudomonas sp. 2725 TaxID=3156449 RepID=UPI003D1DE0DF
MMVTDPNVIELICTHVDEESSCVRTFKFKPTTAGKFPTYLAGQFITLLIEIDGVSVRRCYTLSSSPLGDAPQEELAITVKSKEGGQVSTWLHQNMLPGVRINSLPPAGRFHVSEKTPEKYAFFAGGVGITPVLSMTRWLAESGCTLDIVFIQCASEASELLFVKELEGYATKPGFRLHLQPSRGNNWSGVHGRLTAEGLKILIPDFHERQVLCCGPDGFMSHVQALAQALGVPNNRYFQESFEVDTHHYGDIDETATLENYTITFSNDGTKVNCRGDQTLLAAARDAGVYIPYSCEAGICGSCKVKVTQGQVTGQNDGGLEDGETDQGWTLACCYRPVTDLIIES